MDRNITRVWGKTLSEAQHKGEANAENGANT